MTMNKVLIETELFERLRRAMDIIEKNPQTAAEVSVLFKEFVESVEEITVELEEMPDVLMAETLRELFLISCME